MCRKELIIVAAYCVCFFLLNYFYDSLPQKSPSARKLYYFAYTFLEYFSFTLLLFLSIKNARFKKNIIFASIIFLIFHILYSIFTKLRRLDTIPIGVETILIFIFVLYFFLEQFNNVEKNVSLFGNFAFWIVLGVIFYLGSTFFFNILANHMDKNEVLEYWSFSYLADIIKNLFFAIGIFVWAKNSHKKIIKKEKTPFLDMI
jgi:hypothetical protein